MPELPEVETIKLGLQSKIVNSKIIKVQILNAKSFQGNPNLVEGHKITDIFRRAKVLGISLDNETTILIHLKMSGQLIFEGKGKFIGGHPTKDMFGALPNKSTRVVFSFSGGSKLYFNDQRKFGWIKIIENSKLRIDNFLQKLGPEPLHNKFTWQLLKENLLKHKSLPIKVALLDQSTVSGIGNIYASEACFDAKLNPAKQVKNLSDPEFQKIHQGIIEALKNGIKYGGSSRAHFVNAEGKKGLFLDHAYVYSRAGEPCKVCGTPIKKIRQSGRSTFFCPNCQK